MNYLYALQCIRESAPLFFNYFFLFISEICLKIAVVAACIIYWSFDKKAGASILIGYSTSYSLNQTVKNIACIYRPWILDSRLHYEPMAASSATGYSFPSGHTVTGASLYGGISVWKKNKKWIVILMSFMICLTAFSRNWLGCHTMKDVVTAICIAAVSLSLNYLIAYWVNKSSARDTVVLIAGVALSVIVLIILCLKPYPLDYSADGTLIVDPYPMLTDCFTACGMTCGALLGWWLERHFVNFDCRGTAKNRIIRALIGTAIFGAMYAGFTPLFRFMGPHFAHLVKYFIIFIVVLFVYPLCVAKIQKLQHAKSYAAGGEQTAVDNAYAAGGEQIAADNAETAGEQTSAENQESEQHV